MQTKSTIDKAFDILLLFRERRQITIEDITHELDLPKSTVYRYVRILCEKGFLEKTASADYRPGLTILELSRAALESNRDIRLVALPSMKRIAEQVGESVSLMRIFNRHVICIESIEGRHALRVTIEQGRSQPLHAGASSKLLLAYMDEEKWPDYLEMPLKRFTENTITSLDDLRAEMQHIRKRAYSVSNGEIDTGARAVAVPLFNSRQEAIAALSIEAPASRMDDDTVMRYVEILSYEAAVTQQELN
ncbi:MAG: IclR family transcriptional regulator [Anaerolineae bacterium]|nr:IclR family transcriptional regulator [Anaerolineae bacterium]